MDDEDHYIHVYNQDRSTTDPRILEKNEYPCPRGNTDGTTSLMNAFLDGISLNSAVRKKSNILQANVTMHSILSQVYPCIFVRMKIQTGNKNTLGVWK